VSEPAIVVDLTKGVPVNIGGNASPEWIATALRALRLDSVFELRAGWDDDIAATEAIHELPIFASTGVPTIASNRRLAARTSASLEAIFRLPIWALLSRLSRRLRNAQKVAHHFDRTRGQS
jgi:hypothetical protein